ncbi:MAG: hypothetical protein CSA66_04610 [Proteobacteria bacterium]|nr:MAG: hypothetical protein CSA66_04610 [Pseudomonadota bacterium]
MNTRTLAEIYVGQGHLKQAVDIYRRLVAAAPDDQALAARLAELRGQAGAELSATRGGARVDRLRALLRKIQARRRSS